MASGVFTVTKDGDVYIITSAEGVDRVTNVEEFVFTDRTLSAADMDVIARRLEETSDAAAGTDTDYTMSVGDTFSGRLHRNHDSDWVAISLTAGQTYTISLAGVGGGGGTLFDPILRIYDSSGSFITFDNDGGSGRDSQLTFTATASGTYYISAGAFYNGSAGSYTIGVTDISRDVQVVGTDGDDVITSGDGPDTINSGAGDDTINAGGGNDLIFSGRGNDSIDGGADFDHAHFGVASGVFTVTRDGDVYIITSAEGVDRVTNVEEFVFGDTTLNAAQMDALARMHAGDPLLVGDAGNDDLTGTEGSDRINGGAGDDTIRSGAGDDLIWAWEGDNLIESGDDHDSIYSGAGADTILSGGGADTISSGAGNDRIFSGAGADTIKGGDDNDSLDGGFGNDSLDGGGGMDQARFRVADRKFAVTKDGDVYTIVSAFGTDRVTNVEEFVFGGTTLSAADMDALAGKHADNPQLLVGGAGNDTLDGGAGADTIRSGDGDNLIWAWEGDNSIESGDDHDSIYSGAGADTIRAGDGDNRIESRAGADTILSGDDNDSITAGAGHDRIFSGAGDDTIRSGEGDDSILSGTGDDVLFGGAGADTFVFNSGHDTDVINDFGIGIDTLRLSGALTGGMTDVEDIISTYATLSNGAVVFDFGGDDIITISNLASLTGLSADIEIF